MTAIIMRVGRRLFRSRYSYRKTETVAAEAERLNAGNKQASKWQCLTSDIRKVLVLCNCGSVSVLFHFSKTNRLVLRSFLTLYELLRLCSVGLLRNCDCTMCTNTHVHVLKSRVRLYMAYQKFLPHPSSCY
jgi:hypothetical protein